MLLTSLADAICVELVSQYEHDAYYTIPECSIWGNHAMPIEWELRVRPNEQPGRYLLTLEFWDDYVIAYIAAQCEVIIEYTDHDIIAKILRVLDTFTH